MVGELLSGSYEVTMPYQLPNQRIRRALLDAEYAKSGVAVYEVTHREYKTNWMHICEEEYTSSQFLGLCYSDKAALAHELPSTFILINKSLPNYKKLMVFWHEIGHYACLKAHCLCACTKRGFEFRKTELHAELACIYIASQRGFQAMTLELVQEAVEDLLNTGSRSFDYIRNATMMVKHPSFAAAVDFVREDFNKWLHSHSLLRERYKVALADVGTRTCRWKPSRYLQRFVVSV